jgi:hypothetical protein
VATGWEKKLYWYTPFGRIEVMEPLWRNDTGIERPFSAVAGVSCRGRSLPLQRGMTDFGADDAGPGVAKLKEHYGIEMPVSTMQRTTEHHAHCIYEQEVARVIGPGTAAGGLSAKWTARWCRWWNRHRRLKTNIKMRC